MANYGKYLLYTYSDHGIQAGITLSEITEFLLSKGLPKYETDKEIEVLKTFGNDIIFGEYAFDSNKKVWMYITK